LISLYLDFALFDGAAAAAGGAEFFCGGLDYRSGEVGGEIIDYDYRFAAAVGFFFSQDYAAHFP
jgi:hypothetical protein